MNKSLLVVTGIQRSGNTLLAQLLGNHSRIKMEINPSLTTVFNAHNYLLRNIRNNEVGDLDYVKKTIDTNLNLWYPDRLNGFDFSNWHSDILPNYIDANLKDGDCLYLGIKIPDYCSKLEEIELLTRNTKYINIIRDPRNVVKSQINKINIDLVNSLHTWKQAFFKSCYYQTIFSEQQYLTLMYEDLVSNPETTIRRTCDFLSIDFEESMLTLRDTNTESPNSYILPTFDETKFLAYRTALTSKQILNIESYCGQEMKQLGYKFDNILPQQKVMTKQLLVYSQLRQDFKNLFNPNKKHMTDNTIKTVRVSFKKRFKSFGKTLSYILLPKGLLDALFTNNKLNR